jgi:hypothetical protein
MYSGKYKYEKWRAVSRYASHSVDNAKGLSGVENVLFIYCDMKDSCVGEITKLISVSDILKSNYNDPILQGMYNYNIDVLSL